MQNAAAAAVVVAAYVFIINYIPHARCWRFFSLFRLYSECLFLLLTVFGYYNRCDDKNEQENSNNNQNDAKKGKVNSTMIVVREKEKESGKNFVFLWGWCTNKCFFCMIH